jgi:hypothetical protein
MSRNTAFALSVLGCLAIFALAQETVPITGQWTVNGSLIDDQVELTIQRGVPGRNMSSSSPIALSQLRGLTRAQLDSSGSMARFELARDAGTLQLAGYLQNGGGGGAFTFTPNPRFAAEMRALGYDGLSEEKVFTMAIHDVSAAYVREMKALGIHPDSGDQLITMRIHNVTVEFVRDLKGLGYADVPADKLVTLCIHGVTADFIQEVDALGYHHPSLDQLVTMRIHGITPDYIRKTRSLGLANLTIDQLVSVKIHGVVD